MMRRDVLQRRLNDLYERYHRRSLVSPDPLQFLYDYPNIEDREIVGMVAAALAYGRVKQILVSVADVLARMPSPARFVRLSSDGKIRESFSNFKHRFTSGDDIAALLIAIKRVKADHGSLLSCFSSGTNQADDTVLPTLSKFVRELRSSEVKNCGGFLATPEDGSACKRLNLFLRWMVRHDDVDPGGWESVGAARLIIPLDTHVARIGKRLGLTDRNAADLKMAVEITDGLKHFDANDPVKYDFVLSRLGIRNDVEAEKFFNSCSRKVVS